MAVGDLAGSDNEPEIESDDETVTPDLSASPQDADDEPASLDADTSSGETSATTSGDAIGGTSSPTDVPPAPAVDHDRPRRPPVGPLLPDVPAQASPSTMTVPTVATAATPTRALNYRSEQDRNRSVYRRANPWYRQLARSIVALTLLGGIGVGVYFGVRSTQDWFDRARLPAAGADTPAFRTTTFQIRSNAPAPELEGTLTIDTQTRAFEFIGGPTGSQAGRHVVSADGGLAYSRASNGRWTPLSDNDPLSRDIRRAVTYLSDDNSADAILTHRLRRGYVDLIDEVDEGEGASTLTRYDMHLNTRAFSLDFPVQWQDFQSTAIPGVGESNTLAVTIKLDTEHVLVAVTDEQTGWRWQRLEYFDRAASIVNPAESLLEATTAPAAPEETPADSAGPPVPSTSIPAGG